MEEATSQAVEAVAPWRKELAAAVRGAGSKPEANAALKAWAKRNAEFAPLVKLINESVMRSWMAGRMFVRDFELRPRGVLLSSRVKLDVRTGLKTSLLGMPYEEAVKLFRSREIVTPEVFNERDQQARQRSFMATRLMSDTLLETAQRELTNHLERGGTFQEFADAIESADQGFATFGISDTSRGYLQTVFNTNVASAYGVGRLEELSTPEAIEAIPYRQFRAIEDGGEDNGGRTRETHLALNLKLWRADDSTWQQFAPPVGFNCRCSLVAVETADEAGGDIATLLSMAAVHPDPGFTGASLTL